MPIKDYGYTHDETRESLEAQFGQVWDTQEATAAFDFIGFGAPFVSVIRKSDQVKGALEFQHSPRFYHSFQPT